MSRVTESSLQFTAIPQVPERVSWPLAYQQVSKLPNFAEMEAIRNSIGESCYIEENWDGYGAIPISLEAKRNALAAVNALAGISVPPAIIPNSNGTLSFEWETEKGVGHLEIGKTRYSFYVKPRSGKAILSDGDANKVFSFLADFVNVVLFPKPSEPAFHTLKFLATNE